MARSALGLSAGASDEADASVNVNVKDYIAQENSRRRMSGSVTFTASHANDSAALVDNADDYVDYDDEYVRDRQRMMAESAADADEGNAEDGALNGGSDSDESVNGREREGSAARVDGLLPKRDQALKFKGLKRAIKTAMEDSGKTKENDDTRRRLSMSTATVKAAALKKERELNMREPDFDDDGIRFEEVADFADPDDGKPDATLARALNLAAEETEKALLEFERANRYEPIFGDFGSRVILSRRKR